MGQAILETVLCSLCVTSSFLLQIMDLLKSVSVSASEAAPQEEDAAEGLMWRPDPKDTKQHQIEVIRRYGNILIIYLGSHPSG